MKKIVLKLELRDGDEKGKQKAMTTASGLSGVESVAMDMKGKKLTITGDIDPVKVVGKLRKICQTEIVTVGPAKPEENKKKDDKEPSKDEKNKGGGGGGGDQKNKGDPPPPPRPPPQYYYQNYPPPNFQYQPYLMNQNDPTNNNRYHHPSEEEPNSCVIS